MTNRIKDRRIEIREQQTACRHVLGDAVECVVGVG